MKVTIEPKNTYTIKINGNTFDNMRLVSEWEGYKKFQGPSGVIILSSEETSSFSEIFSSIFGTREPKEMTFEKASPEIISLIKADGENA